MIRRRIPEVMDDPAIDELDHAHALRSLNLSNRLFGVDRRQARALNSLRADGLSVLDLGCGGGGFLGYLAEQHKSLRPLLLVGLDQSASALKSASKWHPGGIRWITADARRIPLADHHMDVVTCSLFLHHFDEADAVAILREAARVARRGIVVVDLRRSRLAWILTWLVTRLLSRSWIFHVDGPRSVLAAFRISELRDLARMAGLQDVSVKRSFPFRAILAWKAPELLREFCR